MIESRFTRQTKAKPRWSSDPTHCYHSGTSLHMAYGFIYSETGEKMRKKEDTQLTNEMAECRNSETRANEINVRKVKDKPTHLYHLLASQLAVQADKVSLPLSICLAILSNRNKLLICVCVCVFVQSHPSGSCHRW